MPATEITLDDDYDDANYDEMCECEMDLTCWLHGGGPSFIERRYQGLDEEEARAFGRYAIEYGEPF